MSMGLVVMVITVVMSITVVMAITVVMIVAAMLVVMVVVMIMIMVIVIMMVVMAVIMRMAVGMIVPGVAMRRLLGMGVPGIGAALGIERRLDLEDAGPQPLHHRLDDMVAADAQSLRHDLGRQMPVAEMPRDPDQMMRIAAADFEQRLGRGDHFDQAAVLQHQRIAAAQGDGIFEIEQELEPARPRHRHPPPVPVVEIEHHGIGGGIRPAMLAQDFCGADHEDFSV